MKYVSVEVAKDYVEAIDKFHKAAMLIHEACPPKLMYHHEEFIGEVQTVRFYMKQIKSFINTIDAELSWFDIALEENKEFEECMKAKKKKRVREVPKST